MDEPGNVITALPGDEIAGDVTISHTANLTWMGAFFVEAEGLEQQRPGTPEIVLEWDDERYDDAPEKSRFFGPEDVRRSTYRVRGKVPTAAPPGVYRLSRISFQTAGERNVRLDEHHLDESLTALAVEVVEERAEQTRLINFRFLG